MEAIQDVMKKQLQSPKFQERSAQLKQQVLNHQDIQSFIKANAISKAIVENSYPQLFEYMTEQQRFIKTGSSQNEGFEPVLLFDGHTIDVSYKPTQAFLNAQEQKEVAKRIQTFEMPTGIKHITLGTIDVDKENKDAILYFKEVLMQLKNGHSVKGAYLYGSFGVGKTHLIGALAGTLAKEDFSSYLAHVPSLIVELKTSIQTNTLNAKLDTIKKMPILMLDDIGGESLTDWVRDDIFMVILDYRMRENLPTFFTSNLSFDALEKHFLGKHIEDERKAIRLMERIKFLAKPLEIAGRNRRNG